MAGDFAANFLIYGNVRDLVKESYHRYEGEPVDSLVVALSTVGLAADVATFFPPTTEAGAPAETGLSLLKALKRAGAMTAEFAAKLLELAKGVRSAEHMKELATCTVDAVKLWHRLPAGAIRCVMGTVKSTEELAEVTKLADQAPKEVALICKLAEEDGMAELKGAGASKEALTSYLKFGRRTVVTVLEPTHVAIGVMKNLRAIQLSGFFHNALSDRTRLSIAWFGGILALCSLINTARHVRGAFGRGPPHPAVEKVDSSIPRPIAPV
jgi:hypothetical protein